MWFLLDLEHFRHCYKIDSTKQGGLLKLLGINLKSKISSEIFIKSNKGETLTTLSSGPAFEMFLKGAVGYYRNAIKKSEK